MRIRDFVQLKMKEEDWTQTKFARECKISQSTVSNIIADDTDVSDETARKIALRFGVAVEYMNPDDIQHLINRLESYPPVKRSAVLRLIQEVLKSAEALEKHP